jgi:dTDP-4-dehydrorhamnose reductase
MLAPMTAGEDLAVRPLVIGAAGLVGRALADRLEELYPHTVSATRAELDLADRWRVEAEIERLAPTVAVNCAAVSDVDLCERDPLLARRVNAEGPAHLAAACANAGVRLIQVSTDYVFGGGQGRPRSRAAGPVEMDYDEAEPPDPVNEYGRSKLLGEMAVLENLVDAVVLRVSFVFGPGRPTFLDKILARARGGSGPIPVIDDWTSKPTHVDEIVGAIVNFIGPGAAETGVWHVAGGGAGLSRLAFARAVLGLAGHDPARAVALDPAQLVLDARRPSATPLATRRYEARFGPLRPWIEAARAYVAGGA